MLSSYTKDQEQGKVINSHHLCSTLQDVLNNAITQGKETKGIQIGKSKAKLYL